MKKRLLCPNLPKPGHPTHLTENEAHHATRVLRLREGDIIEAMDGKGHHALATLRVKGGLPRLEYLETKECEALSRPKSPILPVILEMAVLKGDAMEWVIEKAVELGVTQVIPVLTDHTVVQIKSKGPEAFRDRWQKIADQALKQCGRLHKMQVELPIDLEDLLAAHSKSSPSIRLWCDEEGLGKSPHLLEWFRSHTHPKGTTFRLLIGPEGGWSSNERTLLSQESQLTQTFRIDLGPNILRAETASLFAISLVTAFALQEQ